jgi:hypothetical protein
LKEDTRLEISGFGTRISDISRPAADFHSISRAIA